MKAFLAVSLLGAVSSLPAGVLVAHPVADDLSEPPVYQYQYGVADDYSGANFAQSEQRDGYSTSGSYTVNLPDGRVQTVTYTDNGDGIIQDVSYTGTPQYGPTVGVAVSKVAHPVVAHPVVAHPVVAHPVVAHPVVVAPHAVVPHAIVG